MMPRSTSTSRSDLLLQQIMAQQNSIAADVSAMRADVARANTRLEVIDARNKQADDDHKDFEARIRVLERFRWQIGGLAILGGIVAASVGSWLTHVLH